MNENLFQVTKYWILKERLPYTLNQKHACMKKKLTIQTQQMRNTTPLVACLLIRKAQQREEVRVKVGTYEHDQQYKWQQEQHQPTCVQYMSCNDTAPVYSKCQALLQCQCTVQVMQRYSSSIVMQPVCIVVQYHCCWLTGVEQQCLYTSSHGAVRCDQHNTVQRSVIVDKWRVYQYEYWRTIHSNKNWSLTAPWAPYVENSTDDMTAAPENSITDSSWVCIDSTNQSTLLNQTKRREQSLNGRTRKRGDGAKEWNIQCAAALHSKWSSEESELRDATLPAKIHR